MIATALILIALSAGDLVAGGLSGEPVNRRRTMLGILVTLIVSSVGIAICPVSLMHSLAVVCIATLGTAGWLVAKFLAHSQEQEGYLHAALAWLATLLATSVAVSGTWHSLSLRALDRWLASLPFPMARSLDSGPFLLVIGTILFLSGPCNAIVRCVLTVAGTAWEQSEKRLRGGRFIGTLERWMIFGLAVAGEPTAAALIVSAKSLLRLPELNRTAREEPTRGSTSFDVDVITEYFLLGSLVSWALALAPLILFLAP